MKKRPQVINLELEDLAGLYKETSQTENYIAELEFENERLRTANNFSKDMFDQISDCCSRLKRDLAETKKQYRNYRNTIREYLGCNDER